MALSKADQKAAAEREERITAEGLYVALESDDNSVAVTDDGFIGVSDEYKNFANETDAPLAAEEGPEADAEEVARQHEADMKELSLAVNPVHGHSTDDTPASERTKPQDRYIEGNRTLMDRAVGDEGGDKQEASSPFDSGSSS